MKPEHLITVANFGLPGERHRHAYEPGDTFFNQLVQAHQGLSEAQSEQLNARLVLLLANHIGDLRVLGEALALARESLAPGDSA
ncbi:DUF2783 domain-containing protein [Rubrivivax rivuli]|uniref:DUF2783 domain-containing protein n=1 Tax=Rubrivivax rivuli TaxID=1862385 RepID=A0A437RLF5_9BURK|nr:DUF2783 domain-containing protein [Rubrivivax rivuli]RVU47574.1 DUF2783 domain-containing protein [Rubrivivax rivuli]